MEKVLPGSISTSHIIKLWEEIQVEKRKLKKQREAAAKLSRPRPVELPSGRWRCQVMVGGKRIDVIEDEPETAHAKALAIKSGLLEQDKSPAEMSVGDAIERYIQSKDAVLSPSTIRGYKSLQRTALAGIERESLRGLTQEHVQRLVNALAKEHSPKYVANAHGLLSAAIGMYRPNMVLRTTLPQKEKKEIQIPTIEEIQILAGKAKGTRFELPFLLAVWMGLRASEIRGLTWDCIDGGTLHVRQALVRGEEKMELKKTKTYSGDRKIKIPAYIMKLIENTPHRSDYIIPCSHNTFYKQFERLTEKCGLPHYRFHDLRHVQASVLLALNVPDKYAMERMGHATTNMLKNVYQHTMKDKSKDVSIAVDSFFEEKLHTDFHK